jgi:ABC-2 type transport system ATP-binding protein
MAFLEVTDLSKTYGDRTAIDRITFSIDAGQVVGLVGPNGSGKSTTIKLLAGTLEPDRGTIRLNQTRFQPERPADRSRIGYVSQNVALYPELTARENMSFFAALYGPVVSSTISGILDEVGLSEEADRPVAALSGGMQRRVHFGIGLIHRPQLLLLDEPTVGADPESRDRVLEAITERGRCGTAILIASHYPDEIKAVCDQTLRLASGRLAGTSASNAANPAGTR